MKLYRSADLVNAIVQPSKLKLVLESNTVQIR